MMTLNKKDLKLVTKIYVACIVDAHSVGLKYNDEGEIDNEEAEQLSIALREFSSKVRGTNPLLYSLPHIIDYVKQIKSL